MRISLPVANARSDLIFRQFMFVFHFYAINDNISDGRGNIVDLEHIDNAIVENYRNLRRRIGVLAAVFPLILIGVGAYWGFGIQPTLSDYYFATEPLGNRVDAFPVRLWFCGFLFVVGVFLYKYRGFSENENRWLSAAGIFALGVAVFPMSLGGKSDYAWILGWTGLPLSVHGICAVLAFVCIAVVILWYSESTLSEIKTSKPVIYRRFKIAYFLISAFMILSIGTSLYLHFSNQQKGSYILWAEASGIWAFALYWFVKNWELTEVAKELKGRNTPMPQRTLAHLADKL